MRLPFGVAGALSIFAAFSVSAAEPLVIKIPCDSDPFPKCVDLKKRLIEGVGSETGLNGAVMDLMNDIYAGKVKVPAQGPEGSCTTLNLAGKPEICPPLKLTENGCKDETQVNKNEKTCADFAKVGAKGNGQYYFTLGRSTSGSRETANIAGGLVVAVSDRAIEIAKEVGKNQLTVAPTSPCYSQAQALNQLIQAQSDVKLLGMVKGCDVTNTETCSTKKYFEASLDTIEAAYVLLARCRLTAEATNQFRSFAIDYQKDIEEAVVKDCFYNFGGTPALMKRCYQSKYSSWLRRRAKDSFPNAAALCQN